MSLRESIRRIIRENDYSPAGKEVIPNKIIVHKSNPMFRDEILENGLKVRVGECYQIYVNREQRDPNKIKCTPVIFATNSTKKIDLFDSTYDDDIWEINTEMIPDVKWYIDRHYGSELKHIVTYQDIPRESITLIYEGTGDSEDLLQESIRRIIREERNVSPRLLRRISGNDLEQIFIDCYYEALNDVVHEKFHYETNRLVRLINRTIRYMMDEFHPMLYNTMPEGEMWYDEIHNGLERHYKGRIINLYNNKTPRSDFNY